MAAPSGLQPGDALVVVDVQRDFCAGGTLAVPDSDQIVPVLNAWVEAAVAQGVPVIFTRDWHPTDHSSFRAHGGPWPPHCIQGSPGAEFPEQLMVPAAAYLVAKGQERTSPGYSAFEGTGLARLLRSLGVERLWLGGLATDYCVRATALAARQAGFAVQLIAAATRPVDPQTGQRACDEMLRAGVRIVEETTHDRPGA